MSPYQKNRDATPEEMAAYHAAVDAAVKGGVSEPSSASPLPEGRADGRGWPCDDSTLHVHKAGPCPGWPFPKTHAEDLLYLHDTVAAPVVAVPGGQDAVEYHPDPEPLRDGLNDINRSRNIDFSQAVVAVPEAGERIRFVMGCPNGGHVCYESRCHCTCRHCVNGTEEAADLRGRDLRNLETYPDQRIGRPAPAVPVGVQPEPAEEPTCPATGHPCDLDCPADEAPGLCAAPAVPVVHPEPGDRAACVFCEKAKAEKWTRTVESFEPLNPVTPGHRLFVPREHVTDAAENHVLTGATFEAAARYAESRGEAFNLITSAGTAATQTVPHLHVHYVPRRFDDGLPLPWTGQRDLAAAVAAVRADHDRLAGQVAAIRALCERGFEHYSRYDRETHLETIYVPLDAVLDALGGGPVDGPCGHCSHFRESHNFDENALRGLTLGHCVRIGCDCPSYLVASSPTTPEAS